jgi:integrase
MLAHIKRRKRPAHKRRLTQLYVDKAKPGLTWDTKQGGLALRVQPGGAKAWVVVYSRHGRSRWLTLGKASKIGLSDARTEAAKVMVAVMQGQDPAAERKAERGAGTFADLAAKYLEHAKRVNKSWPQSDSLVRRFAIPRWGKLAAAAVTRGDVRALMAHIESPSLANQTLAAISAIFSWGIEQEIVVANPCRLVRRNVIKSRERVLSDSELPKFWKAFGDLDPVRGTALKMILLTGQRPGEISHLLRQHIVDGWWEMPGEPIATIGWPGTKNGESHRVWLSKPVQDLLAAMSDGNDSTGFVFASPRGGPISKLDDAMRSICGKLKIERATPHDLRRTFSTTVTSLGFGRDALNRVTNHKDGGIASVYDRHGYADENKRVIERVAAKIMALVEGRETDNVVTLQRPANG